MMGEGMLGKKTVLEAICVPHMDWHSRKKLSADETGRLIMAFNARFATWSLVPQFFCANDSRDRVRFLVVKSVQYDPPAGALTPTDEEIANMSYFLMGFFAALRREA